MQVKYRRWFTSVHPKGNCDFLQQETTFYWKQVAGQHLTQSWVCWWPERVFRGEGRGGWEQEESGVNRCCWGAISSGFLQVGWSWVGHELPVGEVWSCCCFNQLGNRTTSVILPAYPLLPPIEVVSLIELASESKTASDDTMYCTPMTPILFHTLPWASCAPGCPLPKLRLSVTTKNYHRGKMLSLS